MESANTPSNTQLLQRLTPIGQFSPEAFREAVEKTAIKRIPAGTKLFRSDQTDDWTIYILDGTVRLTTDGPGFETIVGGSDKAEMPLAPQQPRRATATAATEVQVARLSSSLLEVLGQPVAAGSDGVECVEEDDDEVGSRLLCDIFQDFVSDKLEVPTLPDVALRVRKAAEDPNARVGDIVDIVSADPAIAARLVSVANSPAYRGVSAVESCRDAIVRLGLGTTKELVSSIAMKGLYRTTSPLLEQRMQGLWRHSTLIAAICALLAKRSRSINPDRALLAGLVHDIGALSVIRRAEEYPELSSDPEQLDLTVAKLRGQVGSMILRKWEFTDDVVLSALEAEDWLRDPSPDADCCDAVLIAHVLSYAGTPELQTVPSLPTLPAFKKLGLEGTSPEECLSIIDEAGDAVAELHSTLEG